MNKTFWDKFYSQPLDKIPWQNTQADWFKELIDSREIKGDSALDLGCGTGMKSIYLAEHGFERVVGVDISPRAIKIAEQNARRSEVDSKCMFFNGDVADLNFLQKNDKFDLILDWATIHCLSPEQREVYAKQIEKYSHPGSFILVRGFSSRDGQQYFEEEIQGEKVKIYFLSINNMEKLFPLFKLIKSHESLPQTKAGIFFTEVLFKR